MIFNRGRLLAAAHTALEADREVYDTAVEKLEHDAASAKEEWQTQYAAQWRSAAEHIIMKLNDDQTIDESDLPQRRDRGYGSAFFRRTNTVKPLPYVAPQELLNLIGLLEASDAETISTSALKDLGFSNLRKIAPLLRPAKQATS